MKVITTEAHGHIPAGAELTDVMGDGAFFVGTFGSEDVRVPKYKCTFVVDQSFSPQRVVQSQGVPPLTVSAPPLVKMQPPSLNQVQANQPTTLAPISDEHLRKMIVRLESMSSDLHAPRDGQGLYIGDGKLNRPGTDLRSNNVLSCLKELQAFRQGVQPTKPETKPELRSTTKYLGEPEQVGTMFKVEKKDAFSQAVFESASTAQRREYHSQVDRFDSESPLVLDERTRASHLT